MARRPLPLLVDALPLYATDAELQGAIYGSGAVEMEATGNWRMTTRLPGFPKMSPLGRRFVPHVIDWFEAREAGGARADRATEEASWHKLTRKRQVAGSGRGPTAA